MTEIKYYIVKVFHKHFEYLFNEDGRQYEFDTHEEARQVLDEVEKKHHGKYLLGIRKEEIEL